MPFIPFWRHLSRLSLTSLEVIATIRSQLSECNLLISAVISWMFSSKIQRSSSRRWNSLPFRWRVSKHWYQEDTTVIWHPVFSRSFRAMNRLKESPSARRTFIPFNKLSGVLGLVYLAFARPTKDRLSCSLIIKFMLFCWPWGFEDTDILPCMSCIQKRKRKRDWF